MGSGRLVASVCIVSVCAPFVQTSRAATIFLDATTNVVQVASDPFGLNNSVSLVDYAAPVQVGVTGDASFGSNPGEVYQSAVVGYRDHAGFAQYAVAPMNAAPITIDGSHYDHVILTDNAGAHVGNTGTCDVSEVALATVLTGGTIFAGSTTSAQTGVAQISGANAAFFNTSPVGVPQPFTVSVTGEAKWGSGPNDKYGSIVVQYRTPTAGITYDSLPIGQARDYFGFNFRVFLTDFTPTLSDNAGLLTVTGQVPEPASVAIIALATSLVMSHRRRRAV